LAIFIKHFLPLIPDKLQKLKPKMFLKLDISKCLADIISFSNTSYRQNTYCLSNKQENAARNIESNKLPCERTPLDETDHHLEHLNKCSTSISQHFAFQFTKTKSETK
jgi:hypothetical protein